MTITRPPRPPAPAIVLLLVLLASATALGVAGDRLWLRRTGQLSTFPMPPRAGFMPPDSATEHAVREAVKRELRVTPEQEPRIDAIIGRQLDEMHALRRDISPRIDSLFTRTRLALDSVLSPEQQRRRDALLARVAPMLDSATLQQMRPR
jgi:hypothetical protein